MNSFALKDGMKLGVASAAAQIEGGRVDSSWQDWCERGFIVDGSSIDNADAHYERVAEDTALMSSLGVRCYRLGVEWARIEPGCGVFDEAVLAHYRDELEGLRRAGIEPLLTLHHFNNPMWFESMGAFEKRDNLKYFLEFVEKTVRALGDLAGEYITINEPNVYAVNGLLFGIWPPGKRSFSAMRRVMSNFVEAHIRSYELIHSIRRELGFDETRVSFANHLRVFQPEGSGILDRLVSSVFKKGFQTSLTRAMTSGVFEWPISKFPGAKPGRYCDFIAVNYYTRSTISGFNNGTASGVPVNDLGWEIYPEGIAEVAREAYATAPLPVYITENGTCDNADAFRSRYIYEHLKALCESDLPVEKYFHWCFIDNFEWLEGESARFGIVHDDYATQKRTVKVSGEFYKELIQNGGVSDEIYEKYVANERYNFN